MAVGSGRKLSDLSREWRKSIWCVEFTVTSLWVDASSGRTKLPAGRRESGKLH